MVEKNPEGVPYQQSAVVTQLQTELENVKALGQTSRAEAIEKQLREFGVKQQAAEERAEAAKSEDAPKDEAARKAPVGRSAVPPARQSTEK